MSETVVKRKRKMDADSDKTKHVRVKEDLYEMLNWIAKIRTTDGKKWRIADFLDPLIRPQVESEFSRVKSLVDKIKKMNEEAE